MKARPIAVLLLLVAACGDAPPPPTPPAPRAVESEVVCPVEGTRFVPSRGVDAQVGGSSVKVCSRGCAIRYELDPSAYGPPR
jgi:hypothetical protein